MNDLVGNELGLKSVISLCIENNIPFASFSMPGEQSITTFIQAEKHPVKMDKNSENVYGTGFIFAPFENDNDLNGKYLLEPDYIFNDHNIDAELIDSLSSVKFYKDADAVNIPENTSKSDFIHNVDQIISLIQEEKLDKAVLSRTHVLKIENIRDTLSELFLDINNTYPNAFCFILNIPEAGLWMGASPEPLLFVNGDKFHTVALAGTKYLNGVPVENVEWSVKEIHEQAVVSHFIEEKLNLLNANIRSTKGPFNSKAAKLVHLKTEFFFNFPDYANKLHVLLSALHPTPSVCGLPVNNAGKLIRKLEKHERSYYTGYLGTVNFNKESNIFVNLRCLQVVKDHMVLYSGAGITGKSDPEKEWKETEQKLETLLSVIKPKLIS